MHVLYYYHLNYVKLTVTFILDKVSIYTPLQNLNIICRLLVTSTASYSEIYIKEGSRARLHGYTGG